jgi:ABC-type antimicrobial peptide transport system permease subunit
MANSFGSIDISKFTSLTIDKKSFLKINNIKVIDTGFLLNTPTIFISFEQFDKIYHKKTKINFIEFLETDDKTINTLKHDIKQLSKKLNILQYHTKDILLDTKEIKEFFDKINLIRVLISFFMLLLSLGVVIVAIAIAIEFKKHSLKIIHTIGVSKNDIGSTLGGIVFIMMIVSLILAIGFVFIQREIFIKILDFNQNFFVSLSIFEVLNIFILSVLFFFIIKYISKIIFKEQK